MLRLAQHDKINAGCSTEPVEVSKSYIYNRKTQSGAVMVYLEIEQQKMLLALARNTIADTLKLDTRLADPDLSDLIYKEMRGAFVTLHINGRLRGCIGYIVAVKPLIETIVEMAGAAAFRDPRFSPLSREEYKAIDIEISVLTPIALVQNIDEIEVGRDGLIISMGQRSGLLLPQVAVEQGWDKFEFLENTCYKAGLSGSAWKTPDVKIEKFSAQVFGEKSIGGEE